MMQRRPVGHHALAVASGGLIGLLGGLIGLGGAEFRLPVLVGVFRLPTLQAIILNKAMSLGVVACALLFRMKAVPVEQLLTHGDVVVNLLLGSLAGAWLGAGQILRMSRMWLDRLVLSLLLGLAVLMLLEGFFGLAGAGNPFADHLVLRWGLGVVAGFVIGVVAAVLGVAGGELLIPTIVLLYGLEIKTAGSLSLAVSLPTMIVGFARYSSSDAFRVLKDEHRLAGYMLAGSLAGAALGASLLGMVQSRWLSTGLGAILLISALKTFQHSSRKKSFV
jgi:uncharacterized membrane protein YfcA